MVWIMGMRVATKGMLSKKAEMRAEAHSSSTMASFSSRDITFSMFSLSTCRPPRYIRAKMLTKTARITTTTGPVFTIKSAKLSPRRCRS